MPSLTRLLVGRTAWSARDPLVPLVVDPKLRGEGAPRGPGGPPYLGFAILLTTLLPLSAATFSYHVIGEDPGAWPKILSSVGLTSSPTGTASIFVVRGANPLTADQWRERMQTGAFVILEGDSPLATAFGFHPTAKRAAVRSVQDLRLPKLSIVWERGVDLPVFELPQQASVFVRERWEGAPLLAGYRHGAGGVLWLATTPGVEGYERYPYLLQALGDLGFEPPFRSSQLWAFFDSAYRARVDVDYFAERWRKAGISTLHIAAWHYYEPDAARDAWLGELIAACHRHAILVYAWLELPHVSDRFWDEHPEWREKTALQQDAHLDWRKLVNLTNREAFQSVAAGVRGLLSRFDWDGVNLAELYFESLEGYSNPARFTPMNADVRREFQQANGFDPMELFDAQSARHPSKDASGMRALLEFRAELARRQQAEWIDEIEKVRRERWHLDLVLTHVDDRFDTRMRDLIGADTSKTLPMLDRHDFTFLIEDPATVWNLGSQRYPQIATRYQALTRSRDKLAIDINIVERYQDVYPTKQQTGLELFQLVHAAAGAFPRVALYFENSILAPDLALLPSAAATVTRLERLGPKLVIESRRGVGLPWKGPALVDGRPWPVANEDTLWLPPGAHEVETAAQPVRSRLVDFNGELLAANVTTAGFEFTYKSSSRAMARLERAPKRIQIDTIDAKPEMAGQILLLPRGQHLVTIIE